MRLALLILAAATLHQPVVLAQTSGYATPPVCDGNYAVVRVSEIKPGMMAKFKEAVAAQQAWYTAAGTKDTIVLMPILERDATSFSETKAMTAHFQGPNGSAMAPPDAGYKAFVDMYRASSTITAEYTICMPKMKM